MGYSFAIPAFPDADPADVPGVVSDWLADETAECEGRCGLRYLAHDLTDGRCEDCHPGDRASPSYMTARERAGS